MSDDTPQPYQLEQVIEPSKYENIDGALKRFVDQTLNINVYTNKGWVKVPVVWSGAERSYQIKHDKELRDSTGALKLPLITIRRTGEEKNAQSRGAIYGQIPVQQDAKGGAYVVTRRILQDKTGNFANAAAGRKTKSRQFNFRTRKLNEKIVYQTISMPQPVYVMCSYEIKLMSEYEQQMNDMKTPFITRPGAMNYVHVYDDHHRYEAWIDGEFDLEGNIGDESQPRYFETNISMRVLGYLIGEDENQEKPKMVIRENAVEVKIGRERVIMGDIPTHLNKDSFYREL